MLLCPYVAGDRLRPCTSSELLAFHFTQTKGSSPLATDAQTQQGFIDERAPLQLLIHHELPMKMRTKMSETTKCRTHPHNEDREAKGDSDGRNSKRVTGTVACSGLVASEFIETFRRNTRTTRTIFEAGQNCKEGN